MGSLMSGWSSSVLSDKEVRLVRNRSLTKEEVAAFWRQQQQQHGRPAPDLNAAAGSPRAAEQETVVVVVPPLGARRRPLEATTSLPPLPLPLPAGRGGTRSNQDLVGGQRLVSSRSELPSPAATAHRHREDFAAFLSENAAAADSSGTNPGWWTRSSWAFLNEEPPKEEEEVLLGRRTQRSFACDQFDAARIVTGNA